METIKHKLEKEPYKFDIHQAIRILESLDRKKRNFKGFGDDPIKISANIDLSFPASDIQLVEIGEDKSYLLNNAFTLTGSSGTLPYSYTEDLARRIKSHDKMFAEFLDIFNHRLFGVLHKSRKQIFYGLGDANSQDNLYVNIISGLLKHRLGKDVPISLLAYYTGLIWKKPLSNERFRYILSHLLKADIKISNDYGYYEQIAPNNLTILGKSNCILGKNASSGKWAPLNGLKVEIGPIDYNHLSLYLKDKLLYNLLTLLRNQLLKIPRKMLCIIKVFNASPLKLDGKTFLGFNSHLGSSSAFSVKFIV